MNFIIKNPNRLMAWRSVIMGVCLFGSPLLWSVPSNGGSAKGQDLAANFDAALGAAYDGNLDLAVSMLQRNHAQAPNTSEHDVETITGLIHLSTVLRDNGNNATAITIAKTALSTIEQSGRSRGNSLSRADSARLYELAGFIYERVLQDPAMAQSAYLQASKIDPDSRGARIGLARLGAAEQARERVIGKGGNP